MTGQNEDEGVVDARTPRLDGHKFEIRVLCGALWRRHHSALLGLHRGMNEMNQYMNQLLLRCFGTASFLENDETVEEVRSFLPHSTSRAFRKFPLQYLFMSQDKDLFSTTSLLLKHASGHSCRLRGSCREGSIYCWYFPLRYP